MPTSLPTDDAVNSCVYSGVTRQWSLLTGIQLLQPQNGDLENREVFFDSVLQWEELASSNGLNVGPSTTLTGKPYIYIYLYIYIYTVSCKAVVCLGESCIIE